MGLVSTYDVEDGDDVLGIHMGGEYYAVALLNEKPEDEIMPPEQCDGCGSTMSEEEAMEVYSSPYGQWPLILRQEGSRYVYTCTRPECGQEYRVQRVSSDLAIF